MGSWSVSCGISNIAITSGHKCVLLPLKDNKGHGYGAWQPATLPIFGEYNDYGGIENIDEDDNTKFIKKHFGVSIDDFAVFLVDGKFTYNREEATEVAGRMKNLDEAEEWRFMWIDRQVYDFMINNHDTYHKGYNDYGTPEMLQLFGFELVEESDKFKNYDSKRFNKLYKKGDVELYSDGRTLLNKENRYIYHFGKGDETSIEKYFDVPEELHYLKDINKAEGWRLLSPSRAKEEVAWVIGARYDNDDYEAILAEMTGKPIAAPKLLYKKYKANLDQFGDRLVHLVNILNNLSPMSGQLLPHALYLTPQCGEYEQHQKLLDKFAEINKSYIDPEYDDED